MSPKRQKLVFKTNKQKNPQQQQQQIHINKKKTKQTYIEVFLMILAALETYFLLL